MITKTAKLYKLHFEFFPDPSYFPDLFPAIICWKRLKLPYRYRSDKTYYLSNSQDFCKDACVTFRILRNFPFEAGPMPPGKHEWSLRRFIQVSSNNKSFLTTLKETDDWSLNRSVECGNWEVGAFTSEVSEGFLCFVCESKFWIKVQVLYYL